MLLKPDYACPSRGLLAATVPKLPAVVVWSQFSAALSGRFHLAQPVPFVAS